MAADLQEADRRSLAALSPRGRRTYSGDIRTVALIDERLVEPLAVNEIAAAVHLSPFHFARMFRRSTDCSPHEYLTRVFHEGTGTTPRALARVRRRALEKRRWKKETRQRTSPG